jgi:DNA repair exonuclease SbcCD ATPase subunit
MQIKNIILYKDAEHIRIVPFDLGKVNIITGESKSGKTALIDIIDYCLGSKDCKVAEGVIRDNVYWFVITVVFNENEEYFIARMNPSIKGVSSISEIYLQQGSFSNNYPAFDEIETNSNLVGLKEFLSRKLNIAENLQVAEGNTREALEVNFKHSRIYCYQPQTLIAQRDYLFYNQTEPFVPQAIKDSLPYFLGAIREDSLKIEQEIARKKRDLNRLVREKNEAEKIYSEGISQAYSLIEEAKQIGILDKTVEVKETNEALKTLENLKDWELDNKQAKVEGENSVLKRLLEERGNFRSELGKLEDTISATESFVKTNFSYSEEVHQQKLRLEHIGIYKEPESINRKICPLCNHELEIEIPAISAINNSLKELNESLDETVREKPRLTKYLNELSKQREEIKEKLLKTENSITALYQEQNEARRLRDLNLRRGKVIGRISLFLESVDFKEDNSIDKRIDTLRSEIDDLSLQIDTESKEEKLASIINKINLQMSTWVSELDVEYVNAPIRFDANKLTLIADTETASIPLS